MNGQVETEADGQGWTPGAGGQDESLRLEGAARRVDDTHNTAAAVDTQHLRRLDDLDAGVTGALRQATHEECRGEVRVLRVRGTADAIEAQVTENVG